MSTSAEVREAYFATRSLSYRHNAILPSRLNLVLLHGHGASASEWADYELALGCCHNIIVVDLRGHGKSGRPRSYKEYHPKEAALDVSQLLSSLNISNCVLIAHSLGAIVALELHAMIGVKIRGLIFVSPVHDNLPFESILRPVLALMSPFIGCLGDGDRKKRIDYALFEKSKERDWRRSCAEIRACGARSYLFWLQRAFEHRSGARWQKVAIPSMIVCGTIDSITSHKTALALARDLVSCEFIRFECEGHMLLLNRRDDIVAIIIAFLGKIEAAS